MNSNEEKYHIENLKIAREFSKGILQEFNDLLEITAAGPGGKVDLPTGVTKDLRKIMGNRVKNYIGNTFEIFEDAESGFFQRYKPTRKAVDNTKALFMRYAAKNKNPSRIIQPLNLLKVILALIMLK